MLSELTTETRFTDSGRRIVSQAVERAGERGLFRVDESTGVVLVLWTLIRWERKVGLVALETMGIDLGRLADDLDVLLTRRRGRCQLGPDDFLYDPATRERVGFKSSFPLETLCNQAVKEAGALNHAYVGSEHLLLAIIGLADAELSAILKNRLVDYECVKLTILELLRS